MFWVPGYPSSPEISGHSTVKNFLENPNEINGDLRARRAPEATLSPRHPLRFALFGVLDCRFDHGDELRPSEEPPVLRVMDDTVLYLVVIDHPGQGARGKV